MPLKPVRTYDDALKMLRNDAPDLLLIDIILAGDKDGIDLAEVINNEFNLPFIFLTANSDAATVNRAKQVKPYAYLVKPFTESDLYSSIEIAFNNYNESTGNRNSLQHETPGFKNSFFIKEGNIFHRVELSDILYVESDNVYLNIYTSKKHYLARMKLDDFIQQSGNENFIRVHRSYAVNLKHLESIGNLSVKAGGKEIPLNKNYREEILHLINQFK